VSGLSERGLYCFSLRDVIMDVEAIVPELTLPIMVLPVLANENEHTQRSSIGEGKQ